MIETAYATKLAAVIDHARAAAAPMIAQIKPLLERAQAQRTDATDIVEIAGVSIVIEYRAGDVRTFASGAQGVMVYPYGYIAGAIGADGEDIDAFIGPDRNSDMVFVIDQMRGPDYLELDEQKVMLGFADELAARAAYMAQYPMRALLMFGGIRAIPARDFRKQLLSAGDGVIRGAARMDAGEMQEVRRLIDNARKKFEASISQNHLEALAQNAASATSTAQRQAFARQARAALGIDPVMLDKKIPTLIEHFVGENVALIKTLGSKTFDEIEKMTTRAFTTGTRHEELADDLMERFDISERHARLIARDQVGKLTAQVAQSRSQDLGVRQFIWETVGDERVRDEHEALEGQTFDYDTGAPEEGMPGEPICCRCSASPIFDDLLDAAADEGED